MKPLLKVEQLSKNFYLNRKRVPIIHPLDIEIFPGETLGLVGESGSGKSTLGKLILNLLPPSTGRIYFEETDIYQMQNLRTRMQIIFQDPSSALNPCMKIYSILSEPYKIHFPDLKKEEREERINPLLEAVGLNQEHLLRYPHELSGGQKQRVGIARAFTVQPQFIVCDEPLSALDAVTQRQILTLLLDMQNKYRVSYLFISHQLDAVKKICHRIAVMYLGRIVELGPVARFFLKPLHPYSEALLMAAPQPDPKIEKSKPLSLLQGELPSPLKIPSGCPFHTRCPYTQPICSKELPPLSEKEAGHFAACHFPII